MDSDRPETHDDADSSIDTHTDRSDADRATRLADGLDGELEIAQPEDFEVQRDGDGEILPVPQRIPGTDKAIMVRPMPPGDFQKWLPVLEGQEEDTDKQAEVMRTYIAEGPGADADVDYVENRLKGGVLGGLLKAIRNAAGYEVLRGNREQELEENAPMLKQIDLEDLEGLARLAQDNSTSR